MRLHPSRAHGATLAAAQTAFAAVAIGASSLAAQQRDTTARRLPVADSVRADSARRAAAAGDSAARRPAARRTRPVATPTIPDSLLHPPISPRRAFFYSFLVPGQGQASLHRPRAAAFFASIEVGSLFMYFKSRNDLNIARAHVADSVFTGYGPPVGTSPDSVPVYRQDPLSYRVRPRELHVQDWVATLVFNHLIAGAEAYVSAHLWDLPAQVSFRPAPRGLGVNATIPW